MKNIIRLIGGTVIAAAAVIAILGIYSVHVMPKLREGAGAERREEIQQKDALEEAVLSDPVLSWHGASSMRAGESYPLWEEIRVQDTYHGYEMSLQEAAARGKVKIQRMQVLDGTGQESADVSVNAADGRIRVERSGIYQVKISGMDKDNNQVQMRFLLAVNRKEYEP